MLRPLSLAAARALDAEPGAGEPVSPLLSRRRPRAVALRVALPVEEAPGPPDPARALALAASPPRLRSGDERRRDRLAETLITSPTDLVRKSQAGFQFTRTSPRNALSPKAFFGELLPVPVPAAPGGSGSDSDGEDSGSEEDAPPPSPTVDGGFFFPDPETDSDSDSDGFVHPTVARLRTPLKQLPVVSPVRPAQPVRRRPPARQHPQKPQDMPERGPCQECGAPAQSAGARFCREHGRAARVVVGGGGALSSGWSSGSGSGSGSSSEEDSD